MKQLHAAEYIHVALLAPGLVKRIYRQPIPENASERTVAITRLLGVRGSGF
jgi:hypothetical protein